MTKHLGLLALVLAGVCAPALVWAQAAPLSSWEDGTDGWQINEDNGQKLAKRVRLSGTGATAGKKSLAVGLCDGYRVALRHDDAALADQISGHKLAIDITAPEGSAEGSLQIGLAMLGKGMEWRVTDLQEVPQDGESHTLTFDISSWPIPNKPEWFNLFLVTNTKEKSQPRTIYIDNFRVGDAVADAAEAAAAPTTAPVATLGAIPATPALFSWEDGMDGWQLEGENGVELPRGISNSGTGVTDGKKSLAIGIVDACLRYEDPTLAAELKGKRVALDVTAPESTAEDQLQVTVAITTTGIDWKAANLQEVARDGKPHTLIFDLSLWELPKNPPSFDLFIVTNTKEKTTPGTFYLDNLRILPPDPSLFSWEDGLAGWRIFAGEDGNPARGISNAETGATDGKRSLAIDMVAGYRAAIRREDSTLAARLKGKKLALDVTAPPGTAQDFVQVAVVVVAERFEWRVSNLEVVPQDGKPHTLIFDLSDWPIPADPGIFFHLGVVTNTAPKTNPKTIYIDNLRVAPQP